MILLNTNKLTEINISQLLNEQRRDEIISLFNQLTNESLLLTARLEAILNTVNEAICLIDEADIVVAWNSRAEKLYGIPADEIIGKPIERFFSNLLLTKVMKERSVVTEQYHKPCPDTHVLINARPVKITDNIVGAVCAERDITEVVQLNQKLTKTNEEMQSLKDTINTMSARKDAFASIYGHSTGICDAVNMAKRVAATSVPVLLRGESGTGKEVFARAIHDASNITGSFMAINCGAIPANLFESELFGYEPGAFTGADRKGKPGLFEKANGGTLFLDEIGDLPKDMQVKLLRTLQDKTFYRVGGNKSVQINARIVAATNRNLEEMIRNGDFREDLYYRLNVVAVSLPALRDRLDDIPELVHKGLQLYGAIYGKTIEKVDPTVMATLLDYTWPGNVRELFNVLERMVVLAESNYLSADNLPNNLFQPASRSNNHKPTTASVTLQQVTTNIEKDLIQQALQDYNNNKAAAAKKLGIPRSTLYYKMQQLGI